MLNFDNSAVPERVPLDYSARLSATKRLSRQLRRWSALALLIVVMALGVIFGPQAYRRWQMLRLQEQCMTADLPSDRPSHEGDMHAAAALLAARPTEYKVRHIGGAVRPDLRWEALRSALHLPPRPGAAAGSAIETTFLHERFTPSGRRLLVVVESLDLVTVIEPAGWTTPAAFLSCDSLELDPNSLRALAVAESNYAYCRSGPGVADPLDHSRFTIPMTVRGVTGTWEYKLGDDARATWRMLDPEPFIAKVNTARVNAIQSRSAKQVEAAR